MIREYSLKNHGEKKIAHNFKVKEFACKDGSDYILIDDEVLDVLQTMRYKINKPINIISGYRTIDYNKKINGALNSYHCKGQAVDIIVNNYDKIELALLAVSCGAYGVIVYDNQNYIHIDTREHFYFKHNK